MQSSMCIEPKLKELSDVDTEESNNGSSQYEVKVLQVVTLLLDRRGQSTGVLAFGLFTTYCWLLECTVTITQH